MTSRPSRPVIALFMAAMVLAVAQVVGTVQLGLTFGQAAAEYLVAAVLAGVIFAVVGAAILGRYPRHQVGWTLLVLAVYGQIQAGAALVIRLVADPSTPIETLPAPVKGLFLLIDAGWVPIFFGVMIWVPLHFPDGALPSRRWRSFVAVALVIGLAATMVFGAASNAFVEGHAVSEAQGGAMLSTSGARALEGPVMLCFAAALLTALASLVVRYRRSAAVTRLQIRWVLVAVAVALPSTAVLFVLVGVFGEQLALFVAVVLQLIPLAIGAAILRYRLFDLDRLVGRTLTYVLLSGLLAAVYGGSVLALTTLLGSTTGRPPAPAVAAATLAAVVAFNPLRTRVQTIIDRRLFRSRADAHTAVDAFGDNLRDRVEVGEIAHDVIDVVDRVLAPASVGLWRPTTTQGGAE